MAPWFWGEQKNSSVSKVWWILWPLAWLASCGYFAAILVRNALYQRRWLSIEELPCRVVSVGNIRVGGTGKTPFTMWLHQQLAQRGHRIGIVSRGYGGKEKGPRLVHKTVGLRDPNLVGDEALLLSERIGENVCVGRSRYDAGMRLLEEKTLDVLVLEDGFQHRQLKRDLDIVVVDAETGFFSKRLLPAGFLREPQSSLSRADIFLILKGERAEKEKLKKRFQRRFGCRSVFEANMKPTCLVTRDEGKWKEVPLSAMAGKKVLAVSGIASPRIFYESIRDWGADIMDAMEFPDHHNYCNKDWKAIVTASRNANLIVTTEKDLVKLERFPVAREKLYAIRVEVDVERERELVAEIEERAHLRHGSHHGLWEVERK
jgi:tetraacyldisaccharide 4'-kinase